VPLKVGAGTSVGAGASVASGATGSEGTSVAGVPQALSRKLETTRTERTTKKIRFTFLLLT
jgi:carbonic anhydrase/acetyltransferase-like protein (isoleucine patch superfamily)